MHFSRPLSYRGPAARLAAVPTAAVLLAAVLFAAPAPADDLGPLAPNLPVPVTASENAIVIDPLYLEVLCDYEASKLWDGWNVAGPVGIASITKVMTYSLALDALDPGLFGFDAQDDDCVSILDEAAETAPAWMNPPLQSGWSVPLDVLLHGMMKRSANGATRAIAKYLVDGVAGGEQDVDAAVDTFLGWMNDRAAEQGMNDSTYCARQGSSISTARDQFRLWLEVSDHPRFFEFTAPGSHTGLACSNPPAGSFVSTASAKGVIGMDAFKTGNKGSTSGPGDCAGMTPCQSCLIAQSTRLGRTLLSFQHKAPGGTSNRWPDARGLFGYGFGKLFTPDLRANTVDGDARAKAQAIDAASPRSVLSAAVVYGGVAGDELRLCSWAVNAEVGTAGKLSCVDDGPIGVIGNGGGCGGSAELGVDVAFLRDDATPVAADAPLFVVAVTNPVNASTLLRGWTIDPAAPSDPVPLGSGTLIPGGDVTIHPLSADLFLTVNQDCGVLWMRSWRMLGDGTLTELSVNGWNFDPVAEHAVAGGSRLNVGGSLMYPVATPVVLDSGEIVLLSWHVNAATGQVNGLAATETSFDGTAPSLLSTRLALGSGTDRFFLMSYRRASDGDLESGVFQVAQDGSAVEVDHTSMSTAAGGVAETHILPLGDQGAVTAVLTDSVPEQSRLIVWEARDDQNSPQVRLFRVADDTDDDLLPGVDLLSDPGLDFRPLPQARTEAEADYVSSRIDRGRLELDVWRVAPRPDLRDSLCCGNGEVDPGEDCDGSDFGGLSCSSFGFNLGSLSCDNVCRVHSDGCYQGTSNEAPQVYGDCGFSTEDCGGDPAACNGSGDCVGGPCQATDSGDRDLGALLSPFNIGGLFHPDGDFRDDNGGLYFCHDFDEEVVCLDDDGWGVCTRCGTGEGETMLGCSCGDDEMCGAGLACFGDEFPNAQGFCWDAVEGPPLWQCAEGSCGQAPWFGDDEMYCEHYPADGADARCEPAWTCSGPQAQKCAAEDVICALPCKPSDPDCDPNALECTSECQDDEHCSEAFGWPPGYTCENTAAGLQCEFTGF